MSKKRKIYESAVKTFEITCYMFPVEEESVENNQIRKTTSQNIQSVVGFDGATIGKVIITPSESVLTTMAANMLGIDSPNQNQKEEALCEVANIISGNIAPFFSHDDEICYINPPRLIKNGEGNVPSGFGEASEESVRVCLDEGIVDIEVLYRIKETQ